MFPRRFASMHGNYMGIIVDTSGKGYPGMMPWQRVSVLFSNDGTARMLLEVLFTQYLCHAAIFISI
jgi:hypothetical protein